MGEHDAMDHLAFYNAGCEPTDGRVGLKMRFRRLIRRLMLPAFQRLVEILGSLCQRLDIAECEVRDLKAQVDDLRRRQEDQAAKIPATIAFGWDYVAMVRRLAVLEEHVDALMTEKKLAHSGREADHASKARIV
jgi:hypothetical protein